MKHEFSAVFEREGEWYIGYCLEVPGANGQDQILDECRESLREAIELILEHRQEQALRGVPRDAIRETISV
jgi:predicted RNase H-like HicB family nuclease